MSGRMIAVTGGNRGIGAATARLFAAEGWRVAILYGSDAEAAAAVRASLPGEGHHAVRADVADPASVAAAAAGLDRVFGALDVLVNNAGWTRAIPHADLDALDEATIERIFRINAMGPLFCVRAFLPLLRRRARAVILTLSRLAGEGTGWRRQVPSPTHVGEGQGEGRLGRTLPRGGSGNPVAPPGPLSHGRGRGSG